MRALEEHKIQRLGSDKSIAVDVRVIAATNKDVKEAISQQRFREDLFHRLAVIEINVPSLNDRSDDIPVLVAHFLKTLSPKKGISKDAVEALQAMQWSGNIRQLRNAIERLCILGEEEISKQDVLTFIPTTV